MSEEAVGQRSIGDRGEIKREAKTTDVMPRLWVGDHSGVYDGISEADEQDRSSDLLEIAAGQSVR